MKSGEIKPEDIATEGFLISAAATAEMDGTCTNTQRLTQWHDRAADPPGDPDPISGSPSTSACG